MNWSVISGDIISSTSFNENGRILIEDSIKELLKDIKEIFNVYGRVIKGDYLECVVPEPIHSLRVALAIKCFVKSIPISETLHYKLNKRIKLFKIYGIRLAIGYGELKRFNPDKEIIDGEAIYLSGRTINELTTYNKERIVIKNTLFFVSKVEKLNNQFEALFEMLDLIISKATPRQCRVLYLKLMNKNEDAIATKLNIAQSAVNQHSTSAGWNAIEKAVNYFKDTINNYK
ncbi:MAG: fumarate hydratase [Bacteroidetes bacterium GWA2_30_7]|nr:MAG: fumarate hydratase [Bacteroidetes bacterium GWA2_30_7]